MQPSSGHIIPFGEHSQDNSCLMLYIAAFYTPVNRANRFDSESAGSHLARDERFALNRTGDAAIIAHFDQQGTGKEAFDDDCGSIGVQVVGNEAQGSSVITCQVPVAKVAPGPNVLMMDGNAWGSFPSPRENFIPVGTINTNWTIHPSQGGGIAYNGETVPYHKSDRIPSQNFDTQLPDWYSVSSSNACNCSAVDNSYLGAGRQEAGAEAYYSGNLSGPPVLWTTSRDAPIANSNILDSVPVYPPPIYAQWLGSDNNSNLPLNQAVIPDIHFVSCFGSTRPLGYTLGVGSSTRVTPLQVNKCHFESTGVMPTTNGSHLFTNEGFSDQQGINNQAPISLGFQVPRTFTIMDLNGPNNPNVHSLATSSRFTLSNGQMPYSRERKDMQNAVERRNLYSSFRAGPQYGCTT
ncbi:hypothetical protein GYMLUDRAFT_63766 [Collybiopsis luxurians FD-317 M1]|uniref:Uncharacterized protein n=1 Tax=Collybiopsis luxurians FD-317 M1 TaxID=944289 RepID=A0A0D0C6F1_9AGAR|nr:hypothetical protein GYMLUDRAFT_63766 [Collybiopsis luxurians FD-317 M1]